MFPFESRGGTLLKDLIYGRKRWKLYPKLFLSRTWLARDFIDQLMGQLTQNATCTRHVITFWIGTQQQVTSTFYEPSRLMRWCGGHHMIEFRMCFPLRSGKMESFMVGILAHCFLKSILQDGRGHPKLSFIGILSQIVHIHTTSTNPSLSNLNTRIDFNILYMLHHTRINHTKKMRCGARWM